MEQADRVDAGAIDVGVLDRRFVRVRNRRKGGITEFDFAIGAPEIFVELMMPDAAFEQFCRDNNVIDVTGTERDADDFDARLQREADAAR